MVITVEDYKRIRQMYLSGISQRNIARELGISRNTVAKYCRGESVPWERKIAQRESSVLTETVIEFIKSCLKEDEIENIKKQRHTAKRIFDRLVAELGFEGGESTVRGAVRELKATVSLAFVPLIFSPGEAMQIDWGLAKVYIKGERVTAHLFCARLCYSGFPFVLAFHRQNQESFLEAFVLCFSFFGGVVEKVIFDNDKVAVKDGFGLHAQKQAGYTALAAHYGFEAVFCNPNQGHEKGLVEGLVGFSRRNFLVPIPKVETLEELNQVLLDRCIRYHSHHIRGKEASVGTMFEQEKQYLRALPVYSFETAKCNSVRVSPFSTVRFDSNDYSVPALYCGKTVSVKGYAEKIAVYFQGDLIASHSRCFDKKRSIYALEHYLPLLEKRKRAVFNASPVRQNLPAEFLAWLKDTTSTHKELMNLLWQCAEYGWQNVWNNTIRSPRESLIEDTVFVTNTNLHEYDQLVRQERGAVCQ